MAWKPDSSLVIDDRAFAILRHAVASAVGGDLSETIACGEADWSAVEAAAVAGKLLLLAERGLKTAGVEAAPSFQAAALRYRQRTMGLNATNLSTLGRLVPRLQEAGLRFAVFKGPLQQHALYGDYFLRPATDIDVLVAPGDFARASHLLVAAGWRLPDECATPWWRHILGEQHFFAGHGDATVDLHHRVQQPGSPPPRGLAGYIRDTAPTPLGPTQVPTLNRTHMTLLSCISFIKAIIRNEAAGTYLCDFAVAIRAMTREEREALAATAARQGLAATLRFVLRAADRVLGVAPLPGLPQPAGESCFDGVDLARIVFTPWSPQARLPRRRRILWELCDPSGPGGRAGTYAKEVLRQVAGDACRRWYNPPTASAPRLVVA